MHNSNVEETLDEPNWRMSYKKLFYSLQKCHCNERLRNCYRLSCRYYNYMIMGHLRLEKNKKHYWTIDEIWTDLKIIAFYRLDFLILMVTLRSCEWAYGRKHTGKQGHGVSLSAETKTESVRVRVFMPKRTDTGKEE